MALTVDDGTVPLRRAGVPAAPPTGPALGRHPVGRCPRHRMTRDASRPSTPQVVEVAEIEASGMLACWDYADAFECRSPSEGACPGQSSGGLSWAQYLDGKHSLRGVG